MRALRHRLPFTAWPCGGHALYCAVLWCGVVFFMPTVLASTVVFLLVLVVHVCFFVFLYVAEVALCAA